MRFWEDASLIPSIDKLHGRLKFRKVKNFYLEPWLENMELKKAIAIIQTKQIFPSSLFPSHAFFFCCCCHTPRLPQRCLHVHVLCTAIIIPHVHETVAINTAMRKHAYTIFQRKHNQRAILTKGGLFPRACSSTFQVLQGHTWDGGE